MANKTCFVVVWFGKLPEYFGFWEKSCGQNQACADFLLVTDQQYSSRYPNIRVQHTTMAALRQKASEKLALPVALDNPYKCTDFKTVYGVIFDEELKGYSYWGMCDLDQVFGDLGMLMNRPDFDSYDKIGRAGHLTLFRNCSEINNLYRKEGALFDYQTVFTTPEHYAFDERTGICRIAQRHKVPYLNILDMRADLWVRIRRLETNTGKNYKKQVFYWENGHLFRAYEKKGQICKEEFLYLHFQKKKLRNLCGNVPDAFFIGREGFFEKTGAVLPEDFDKYNCDDGKIVKYWQIFCYYVKKMTDYFRVSKAQRRIWTAQRSISYERFE